LDEKDSMAGTILAKYVSLGKTKGEHMLGIVFV
jgi:hypothetical protein